jgi:hypothetical protein
LLDHADGRFRQHWCERVDDRRQGSGHDPWPDAASARRTVGLHGRVESLCRLCAKAASANLARSPRRRVSSVGSPARSCVLGSTMSVSNFVGLEGFVAIKSDRHGQWVSQNCAISRSPSLRQRGAHTTIAELRRPRRRRVRARFRRASGRWSAFNQCEEAREARRGFHLHGECFRDSAQGRALYCERRRRSAGRLHASPPSSGEFRWGGFHG